MICAQISRPALYQPTRTFVSTAVLHKNHWTSACQYTAVLAVLPVAGLTSSLSAVRMLDDGEHVIKKGAWDLILSEYHAYTLLQHEAQFPVVCEHFVPGGPGSETAEMLLHRVIGLDTLFNDHGELTTHMFPMYRRGADRHWPIISPLPVPCRGQMRATLGTLTLPHTIDSVPDTLCYTD